jgi:hypothetical protein
MARRTKDAPGRVTPKGGGKSGRVTASATPAASGRYTPPVPKELKESPRWYPVLLVGLLIAGMAVILLNYLGVLPGGAKNAYLLVGLALITLGFIAATRYR